MGKNRKSPCNSDYDANDSNFHMGNAETNLHEISDSEEKEKMSYEPMKINQMLLTLQFSSFKELTAKYA